MEEKVFREFEMTAYNGESTSLEVAIMKKEIFLRKVTIDLAKVTTYRDVNAIDKNGEDVDGTLVELIGSNDYNILTPYKVFDKIMREAFPEAYK